VLRLVDFGGLRPLLAHLLGWTSAQGRVPFDPISTFLFLGWQIVNGWSRAQALRNLKDPRCWSAKSVVAACYFENLLGQTAWDMIEWMATRAFSTSAPGHSTLSALLALVAALSLAGLWQAKRQWPGDEQAEPRDYKEKLVVIPAPL